MLQLNALPEGETVLAAVSGGADSAAMLLLLAREAKRGRIRLFAAHYDHGLRGEASRRDAEFVEKLCARLGVECRVGCGDVRSLAEEWSMGLEEAARRARYDFLNGEMARVGADCVALAHHRGDQAETVLMHILRGASLAGASGMQARSGRLYRPLLNASKAEILAFLEAEGQDYCRDETNFVNDNPRNLIRNRAMPILEAAYPGAEGALCRFAGWARRDDEYLKALAEGLPRATTPFGGILRLGDAPAPLAARAVERLRPMDGQALERVLALRSGGVAETAGARFERWGRDLYMIRGVGAEREAPLMPEGRTELSGVCAVEARATRNGPIKDDPWRQRVDAAALMGCSLRTRRAGDWIQPFGMAGTKSLSDYMTDRKIPRPLRDWLPLIARGSEVVWAAGLGISEKARLTDGPRMEICCEAEDWLAFAVDIRKGEGERA